MAPPLHERIRRLLPEKVLEHVPERLKPPAWREERAAPFAPAWAYAQGSLRYVWGDPAAVWSREPDGGVTVTMDSKGKPIDPVRLPYGTEGRMVAVGPDFVVLQVGEDSDAPRYRVPKDSVINAKPHDERKLGRRRRPVVEVSARDLH
jgi:hypothetical protein